MHQREAAAELVGSVHHEGTARVAQVYETTIASPDAQVTARFIVIPRRSMEKPELLGRPAEFLRSIDATVMFGVTGGTLKEVLCAMVAGRDLKSEGYAVVLDRQHPSFTAGRQAFAEYLMSARLIPFEHSLMGPESLGNLVTNPSIGALAAVMAYEAEDGNPFFFVAVPAGIVLLYVSVGLGEGGRIVARDFVLQARDSWRDWRSRRQARDDLSQPAETDDRGPHVIGDMEILGDSGDDSS